MSGDIAKAKREHHALAVEIRIHDDAYYKQDAPTVSDAKYDALRKRLLAIEAKFPELATKDSPSQHVGAIPSGRFGKITHSVPMLSLDNAFDEGDVKDFAARVRRFLNMAEDAP